MKHPGGLFWIIIILSLMLAPASMAGFIPPAEEGTAAEEGAAEEEGAVAEEEGMAEGEDTAPFEIARLVIAGSVENLEPVGVVDAFAASTEKVYCFLEARQIKQDTTVRFVWFHGETNTAVVELPLRKGQRWRTYSSKKIGGRTGDWRVEIQDTDGNVLDSIGFMVE